jgi:predicted metal-binding protein
MALQVLCAPLCAGCHGVLVLRLMLVPKQNAAAEQIVLLDCSSGWSSFV